MSPALPDNDEAVSDSEPDPDNLSFDCLDPWQTAEMSYVEGDPRLEDPEYAWSTAALLDHSDCVDCHRSPDSEKPPAELYWDIGCQPVWTDSASDEILADFAERVLDPTELRVRLDTRERERLANLVEAELMRRQERRDN